MMSCPKKSIASRMASSAVRFDIVSLRLPIRPRCAAVIPTLPESLSIPYASNRSARRSSTALTATTIEETLISNAAHSGRSMIPNRG